MTPAQRLPEFCPHCGCVLRKPRSPKAHRFFFKIIELAYENWPEDHDFQPDNSEHLRAWLLCRTKYRDIIGERLNQDDGDLPRMRAFTEKVLHLSVHRYCFVIIHNGALVVVAPRSIAYDTLDEVAFAPIREAVFNEIEAQTHLTIAELGHEFERKRASHS